MQGTTRAILIVTLCAGCSSNASSNDAGTSDSAEDAPEDIAVEDTGPPFPMWTVATPTGTSWARIRGLAVTLSSDIVTVGQILANVAPDDFDVWLARLGTDGTTKKMRTWGSAGTSEWAEAVAARNDGSLITVGAASGDGLFDALVQKWTSDFDLTWTRTYDGAAHGRDQAHAVAIDGDGNIVVVGGSRTETGDGEAFVWKLDPLGNTIWRRTFVDPGSIQAYAAAVAVAADGTILVGGYSTVSEDLATVWRLDALGTTRDVHTYGRLCLRTTEPSREFVQPRLLPKNLWGQRRLRSARYRGCSAHISTHQHLVSSRLI